MKQKLTRILVISLVLSMAMQLFFPANRVSAEVNTTQATDANSADVLYLCQKLDGQFERRLRLDNRMNITYVLWDWNTEKAELGDRWNELVTLYNPINYTDIVDIGNYEVVMVNSFLPNDAAFLNNLESNVSNGVGLFFWGGYYPVLANTVNGTVVKDMLPVEFDAPYTVEEETYIDQPWVGQIDLKVNSLYNYDESSSEEAVIFQRNVVWESSPLVRERVHVTDKKAGANVLVYKPDPNRNDPGLNFTGSNTGDPLVVYWKYNTGKVFWISMGVDWIKANFSQYYISGVGPEWNRIPIPGTIEKQDKEWNKPFYLWPYFNFFVYQTTMVLAGVDIENIDTYAKWPHSPIPHELEATLWMIFVAGLWVFNFALFFTLGRKKKRGEGPKPADDEKKAPGESKGKGDKKGESSYVEPPVEDEKAEEKPPSSQEEKNTEEATPPSDSNDEKNKLEETNNAE